MRKITALFVFLLLALPQTIYAQDIDQVRLRFAPGESQTSVTDRIVGREIVDYVFDAKGGQTISIRFAPTSGFAFFNLLAPNDEALFVGQDVGNPGRFDARLGATGRYKIRVYLVRAEARRGGRSDYRLSLSINGGQNKPLPDAGGGIPDDGGPDFYIIAGLSPGDTLNMRNGPSINNGIVARLSNGTILRNLGCQTRGTARWCNVENPRKAGQRGWVNGRFLRESSAPRPDVAPPIEDPGISDDGGPDFYVVSGISRGDLLNMRTGPSFTQPVLAQFANGDILKNLGCRSFGTIRWCNVQDPNNSRQRGWVNGRYLRESAGPVTNIPDEDALVPGTRYNATGEVNCVISGYSKVTSCRFGVIRGDQGYGTVFISLPNGRTRVLEFSTGRVRPVPEVALFGYRRVGDVYVITVNNGQERYTIVDAVINGG